MYSQQGEHDSHRIVGRFCANCGRLERRYGKCTDAGFWECYSSRGKPRYVQRGTVRVPGVDREGEPVRPGKVYRMARGVLHG